MKMPAFRYVAVEGAIGVGKTTLVHRLADTFDAHLLLEAPERNPFLDDFYRNPTMYGLPAQLSFLLQRTRQLDELREFDRCAASCIADFMFEKDRLFAGLILNEADLTLYDRIRERLQWHDPVPDRVVYLRASVDTLLAHIRKRGRPEEQGITAAYLERVNEAYRCFFRTYDRAPVVEVDIEHVDPVSDDAGFGQLLDALGDGRSHIRLPPATMV